MIILISLLIIVIVSSALLIMKLHREQRRAFLDAQAFQDHVQHLHESLKQEKHDLRTHLEVMKKLAKEGNHEQFEDYVTLLQQDSEQNPSAGADRAVGASIAYVKAKGEQHGIAVTTSIHASLNQSMLSQSKEMQLVVNIFSNALEAARKSSEYVTSPFIDIEIKKQYGIIIVDVKNSTAPIPNKTLERMFPKQHPVIEKRGLGTYLIQRAVNDAEGSLDFYVEEHLFHLAIRLPSMAAQ